jgi:hypothetical protein
VLRRDAAEGQDCGETDGGIAVTGQLVDPDELHRLEAMDRLHDGGLLQWREIRRRAHEGETDAGRLQAAENLHGGASHPPVGIGLDESDGAFAAEARIDRRHGLEQDGAKVGVAITRAVEQILFLSLDPHERARAKERPAMLLARCLFELVPEEVRSLSRLLRGDGLAHPCDGLPLGLPYGAPVGLQLVGLTKKQREQEYGHGAALPRYGDVPEAEGDLLPHGPGDRAYDHPAG